MKMHNRRGEVITLTVVAFALLIGIIGIWFGQSKYAKIVGLNASDGQKIRQESIIKSEPVMIKGPDGKEYVFYKTETNENSSSEESKMTIWQKILMFPKLWLLLMIFGIFFPPISALMAVINSKLKTAAKQMVSGIEKGLAAVPPEAKDKILNELSKTYDAKTKLMVSKFKQK